MNRSANYVACILAVLFSAPGVALGLGNALRFDGIDDRVLIGPVPTLSEHTIEAWIQPEPHDGFGFVAGHATGPNHGCTTGVGLRMAGNKACYFLEPSGCANDNSICDEDLEEFGVWMHLAGTWDGTTMRFYVDGELVGERTGVSFFPSNWMTIGAMEAQQGFEAFFSGTIDEIRIWNYARSAAQIRETMLVYLTGNEPGLVGYWRLDEGAGQIATDASTALHHGMLGTEPGEDAGDPQWIASDSPVGYDCMPDEVTLCLNDGRFRVHVEWRNFQGGTGVGKVAEYQTDDSGLFWFFGPSNLELLIKVLDGCRINDRFWVFYAATTTVEFTISVTDTATGSVAEYHNGLGHPADAIADTEAFATCP